MGFSLGALSLAFLAWPASGNGETPFAFKNHMHHILHSYNHARISLNLERYDIVDIHLRQVERSIQRLPEFMPEYNMDGTKFDKGLFIRRLDEFQEKVSRLRTAAQKQQLSDMNRLPRKIFDMCVKCHEEARLKYLFRLPPGTRTLFHDYMHRISENFDLLRIHTEEEVKTGETEVFLRLISYYLELLESTFPDAGPSGVIMNRDDAVNRIRSLKRFTKIMRNDVEKKKPVDIENFRNSLNGFCVACHEPERIK